MAAALLAGTAAAWFTHPSGSGVAPSGDSAGGSASALAASGDRAGSIVPPTPPVPQSMPQSIPQSTQPTALTTARDARAGAAPTDLAPPTRFEVEELGISMPVRPVGVAKDGQMALPPSPAVMGWYQHGPRPGERDGATVLAAHRDMPEFGTGPAARLERVDRGDLLTVRSGNTVRRYRVTQVTRLEKRSLDLATLFARSGPARLHVVTCSGAFDPRTRSYEENLVVVGVPTR